MICRTAFAVLLKLMFVVLLVAVIGGVAAAQSVSLSEVEVRLARIPHGGCAGPCVEYDVTVRGDGTVEYHGADGTRTRTVPVDDVVTLINEFLRARFFNALDTYAACCSFLVRKGDTVAVYGTVSADDPEVRLTLRIGARTKVVTLLRDYPAELSRLPELVDRIGGPQVWR